MCTHATVLLSYANRGGKRWPRKMAHRRKWGDNTPILLNERREHNAMEMPAILLFGRHATREEDVFWSKSCSSRAAYLWSDEGAGLHSFFFSSIFPPLQVSRKILIKPMVLAHLNFVFMSVDRTSKPLRFSL
ncbi:hypothetical protein AVEN_42039-1 [Araneus ventricosus]|uniref:Uncharacterized protein n=1 Tax=Araneus ventricosus TaxID=182803 RepID=A0A4Y2GH11_ARAVE|nr:hypothetical protein AVEN_42039-1 [Araneus ventricosus]